MDRITLRGLRAYGRHGWSPQEREDVQPFEIDVDADIDLRAASLSDDLADSVDYAVLAQRLTDVVEQTSHALIERLAADLLAVVFEEPRIARVVLTVAKPAVLDSVTPSVTLDRVNPNYENT